MAKPVFGRHVNGRSTGHVSRPRWWDGFLRLRLRHHAPPLGYDAAGNLISKTLPGETWTYTWNALNQLTSASRNGALQASFQYDPLGRRVVKSTPAKVTTYTYDGADILRENVTVGGITTTSYYVHGPSIDEPLGKETGGVMTYYHADGLGSIVKETSEAGAVTSTLRYDAWGNIEAGARDGFAFTGREWDPETGLYYYRARYYDPKAGRFISEDPIRFQGGPDFYSYTHDGPATFVDPSGLFLSPWHREITSDAAKLTGLSPNNARNLTKGVADVDGRPGSQWAENSLWHAMSNLFVRYTDQDLARLVTWAIETGDLELALHAVQDNQAGRHGCGEIYLGQVGAPLVGPFHLLDDAFPLLWEYEQAVADSVDVINRFKKRWPLYFAAKDSAVAAEREAQQKFGPGNFRH